MAFIRVNDRRWINLDHVVSIDDEQNGRVLVARMVDGTPQTFEGASRESLLRWLPPGDSTTPTTQALPALDVQQPLAPEEVPDASTR